MESIDELFEQAQHCRRCYGQKQVYVPKPDPKNGFQNVKVMFINERPSRIGTGKSGYVSFENDDPTANHFRYCFEKLGIPREDIFITNACICHPLYKGYIDSAPLVKEIKNCHYWLDRQMKAVNPQLIVTLGNSSLRSMKLFFNESEQLRAFSLKKDIGNAIKETMPYIYPLYHTSQRARLTRTAKQQRKDWLRIVELIN